MIFAEFSGAPNHEIRFLITEAVWMRSAQEKSYWMR